MCVAKFTQAAEYNCLSLLRKDYLFCSGFLMFVANCQHNALGHFRWHFHNLPVFHTFSCSTVALHLTWCDEKWAVLLKWLVWLQGMLAHTTIHAIPDLFYCFVGLEPSNGFCARRCENFQHLISICFSGLSIDMAMHP